MMAMCAAAILVLAACSSSSDDGTNTTAPAGSGDTTAPTGGTDTTAAPAGGGSGGGIGDGGSATLVVGDVTYTFDNFYCLQGSANTGNSRVSFSSGAFGEVDGVRVQLDVGIQDTNEGDAMTGEGTIHYVSLNDIEDFANPSLSWESFGGSDVEYDGSNVHAEMTFDDQTTDDFEEIPGTLDAECGDG